MYINSEKYVQKIMQNSVRFQYMYLYIPYINIYTDLYFDTSSWLIIFLKEAEFSFQDMWSVPERKYYFDIMA